MWSMFLLQPLALGLWQTFVVSAFHDQGKHRASEKGLELVLTRIGIFDSVMQKRSAQCVSVADCSDVDQYFGHLDRMVYVGRILRSFSALLSMFVGRKLKRRKNHRCVDSIDRLHGGSLCYYLVITLSYDPKKKSTDYRHAIVVTEFF